MKKLYFLLFIPLHFANGQEVITLEQCHRAAIQSNPAIQRHPLNAAILKLENERLDKNWLPEITFIAQASYQSDVVNFDLPLPNLRLPDMPKDQYNLSLQLNQLIYDGGMVQAQRQLKTVKHLTDSLQVATDLHQVRNQVNQTYFSILLLHAKEKQLQNMRAELVNNRRQINAAVQAGAMLPANLYEIDAEIIKLNRLLIELAQNKAAAIGVLALITHTPLTVHNTFTAPEPVAPAALSFARPELALLKAQQNQLEETKQLAATQQKPRFSGFGQFGYGKPGMNFLNPQFDTYYYVGARLNWRIWDGQKTKNEARLLSLNQELIDTHMEALEQDLAIAAGHAAAEVEKNHLLIAEDQRIIDLQKKITATYLAQLQNGVVTTAQYLTELNKETQYKLDLESHRLLMIQAQIHYLTLIGNKLYE